MPSDYAKKKAQKKKEAAKQKGGKKPKETESGNFYPQFFYNFQFECEIYHLFYKFIQVKPLQMAHQLQELKMKKMAPMEFLPLTKKNFAKGVCMKNFVKTLCIGSTKFT